MFHLYALCSYSLPIITWSFVWPESLYKWSDGRRGQRNIFGASSLKLMDAKTICCAHLQHRGRTLIIMIIKCTFSGKVTPS